MFWVLSQISCRVNDDLLSSLQRSNFNCFQGVLATSVQIQSQDTPEPKARRINTCLNGTVPTALTDK